MEFTEIMYNKLYTSVFFSLLILCFSNFIIVVGIFRYMFQHKHVWSFHMLETTNEAFLVFTLSAHFLSVQFCDFIFSIFLIGSFLWLYLHIFLSEIFFEFISALILNF